MKLDITLNHCYGISSLKHTFEFGKSGVYAVYASNGVMKTSFAKTFRNISIKKKVSDEVYPAQKTEHTIRKNDSDIHPQEIFSIAPYDDKYESNRIATLLINENLKKKYDEQYAQIKKDKEEFLGKIKESSGHKNTSAIEEEISNVFCQEQHDKFFEALERIEAEVLREDPDNYAQIRYTTIFNEKTDALLKQEDFLKSVKSYVDQYNEIIDKSHFFKKGIFDHSHAFEIAKQLEKNGFFKAEHAIVLNGRQEAIETFDVLKEVIEAEKNAILQDNTLRKKFGEIEKLLDKNAHTRELKDLLSNQPTVTANLYNPLKLKADLWKSYLKDHKEYFRSLLEKYRNAKNIIDEIKEQAKKEKSTWDKVVSEFNAKFFVPFEIYVSNKIDVMLNDVENLSIAFRFGKQDIKKEKLMDILSQGEKKALYILNILFEVEVRKKERQECLFVIDDIADSFDYKNKYAIVDYLREMSEVDGFNLILLTHNFDFFRTIEGRGIVPYNHCLVATKTDSDISLKQAENIRGPFIKNWKNNLQDSKVLIATIPVVRNIIEYTKGRGDQEYETLTSVLHMTKNTENLTVDDVKDVFEKNIKGVDFSKFSQSLLEKHVLSLIYETAEDCLNTEEGIHLEEKITLSIAIRLKAEQFMLSKIKNNNRSFGNNQTPKLVAKYKTEFKEQEENIKILNKVILITPANIHVNAFMYEPIIDMSNRELQELYRQVSQLLT